MMNLTTARVLTMATVVACTFLGACTSAGPKEGPDLLFRELMPRSILVLPPINESVDVKATYSWLTTAARPIAEKGFYVYPVAVMDEFMKENGLHHPEDMHTAPLNKLGEIFGTDAVMYVTIEDYGQKFELTQSKTTVVVRAELIDVKTGQSFWKNRVDYSNYSSDNSGSDLLGAIITAAVAQIGETISDAAHDATRLANVELFGSSSSGLLLGPLHPGFEERRVEAAAETAAIEAQNAQSLTPH